MLQIRNTRELLAWVGGFFDGEGCVVIVKMKNGKYTTWHIQVSMSQKSPEALQAIQKAYGGYLGKPRRTSPVYSLALWDKKAERFLEHMLPYLEIKDKVARLALEARQLKRDPNSRIRGKKNSVNKLSSEAIARLEDLKHRISELNKL